MIRGTTRLAGVLGWPVRHSRSPLIHNHWISEHGVDAAYLPLPVTVSDFRDVLKALPKMGFAGANVTVPHKQSAAEIADTLDPLAERLGAVNTLVFDEDGKIEGRNTDVYGFLENLRAGAPGVDLTTGTAVVLGAGGAARAVIAGLLEAGDMRVRIVNRTQDRAETLAGTFGGGRVEVGPWSAREDSLGDADLLVNATSLGMTGAGPLDLSLDALPTDSVVNDLVYAPLETVLLRAARAKGCTAVDGLGMLLHQAVPAFEAWFRIRPMVSDTLRSLAIADLESGP